MHVLPCWGQSGQSTLLARRRADLARRQTVQPVRRAVVGLSQSAHCAAVLIAGGRDVQLLLPGGSRGGVRALAAQREAGCTLPRVHPAQVCSGPYLLLCATALADRQYLHVKYAIEAVTVCSSRDLCERELPSDDLFMTLPAKLYMASMLLP